MDILCCSGCENVQGEEQQKLDVMPTKPSWRKLAASGECGGIASEENEDVTTFHEGLCRNAKYIVCMDPLDGSSNIDVNVSVGHDILHLPAQIAHRRSRRAGRSLLAKGSEWSLRDTSSTAPPQCSSTRSSGGVNGFTLDPSLGEFCLSHPNIKTPASGKIYSINEGNYENSPSG